MKINKDLKKRIKANYSRKLYGIAKKTIIPINAKHSISEDKLFEFLDYLSEIEKNKQDLNEMLMLYTRNPKFAIKLSDCSLVLTPGNFKKYLDIFGEEILEAHLESILGLNIEHPNIKPILPYLKDNEELVTKLINKKYYITTIRPQNIPGEIIANNFDQYIQALDNDLLVKLNDTEIIKYLSLDKEAVSKFYTWYNLIKSTSIDYSKAPILSDGFTGDFAITTLCKYLIENPHQIDKFIIENQTSNNKFYFLDFLKNPENKNIKDGCIQIIINNDIKFNTQKNLLINLVYTENNLATRLREMIKRQENENHEYPKDIADYLECFKMLDNSNSKDDLIKFYELFNKGNLISHEKMKEYIMIEYSQHLNNLLSKTEDIAKDDRVTISKEQFTSKQYNKTGEIQIYTLHDCPFICLGHSIKGAKMDEYHPDEYQEKKDFTTRLCESPHLWESSPSHGTNYISMSLDTAHKMKTFIYGNLYLGFNQLHDKQIKFSHHTDAATPMKRGTAIENTINLASPENIIARKDVSYSEFGSNREGVLPNFLVTTTTETQTGLPLLTEQTKEWALYYDIPIFVLDSQSYFVGNYTRFKNSLEQLKNSTLFPSKEEIKTLLFSRDLAQLYTKPGEIKYPELTSAYEFDLLLSLAQTNNKEWTPENITNLRYLYETLQNLAHHRPLEPLKELETLIAQKEQEIAFKI